MDYEREYKEARERAKKLHKEALILQLKQDVEDYEYIFPELKESEDDKIRKAIIESLPKYGYLPQTSIKVEDAIAWLEKQGKPNPYSGVSFKYNGHTFGMCARDNGAEILFDEELKAFISAEKSFVYPIHPQPDLAPKNAMEAIKEEKVNNANKLEPKFKVGNWIVTNDNKEIFLIKSSNNGYCTLEDSKGKVYNPCLPPTEDYYHLWTIQDAKDGDVLVDKYSKDKTIILYKGINPNLSILAYCGWNGYNFSIKTYGLGYGGLYNTKYVPATKEQRDLLFQQMKEAGYEWDAEKKELEKVEQKSTWSVEDKLMLNDILMCGERHCYLDARNIAWLKTLKDRVQQQNK